MSRKTKRFTGQNRLLRSALLNSVVGLGVVSMAAPAFAQFEEIVVTARKREEALQDIPVAVTAFTGENLQSVGIDRLDEATALAPNLRIQTSGTGPSVATMFIRGIGYNGTEKLDAPSVGVFIDDFYWGMGHGQLIDTFDVATIEILRGPQSVLFGKNTSGGAVVVRRTKPLGEAAMKAKIGAGNYGQNNVQALFHTPEYAGQIAAKVGVTRKDRDGFAENLYDGTDEGKNTYQAIHSMVSWNPVESLETLWTFDLIEERGEATPLQNNNPLASKLFFGGAPLVPGVGAHHVWPDLQSDQNLDVKRYSVRADWETAIGTITSITGYLDEKDYTLQDFDSGCGADSQGFGCPFPVNPLLTGGGANPTATLHTIRDQEFDEFTEELRIANQVTDTVFVQGGGFYYKDSIVSRQTTNFAAFEYTTQDTESYALFGQVSWEFLPGLTATGGSQWIQEEKEYSKRVNLLPSLGGLVLLPQLRESKKWDDVVWQASLEWAYTDNNLAYISLSDGFRSGGFSARGTAAEQVDATLPNFTGGATNFLSFEPEETREYEIGLKNTFFDGDLILNLTGFYTELNGLQSGAVTLTPAFGVNTNTYVNNFQEVIYKGFEVELAAQIPWVEGLAFSGNYGFLDAQIEEAMVPAVRLGVGPGGLPGSPAQGLIDLSGQPLTQAPEFTYAAVLNYDRDLANGGAVGGTVQYKYTDDVALSAIGTQADIQEGYGLLSASLRYAWENFTIQATAENITDEVYRETSLGNVVFNSFGKPATFLVEFSVNFGT